MWLEVVPGGSTNQNAAPVCSLGTPRGPAQSARQPWVLVKVPRPSSGQAAAGTLVGGGRGLCVTSWLFFNLKRILLEKP